MKQMIVAISLLVPMGLSYGQADIEVNPLFHDFGSLAVGESATLTVRVSNVGDSAIAINVIAFTAGSSSDYALPSLILPRYFSAGGFMEFDVTFTPSAAGLSGATLQISSSDPDEPVVDVVLVGEGIESEMTPEEQIVAILERAEASVEDGTLVGIGPGRSAENRLGAFMNMLESAEDLILSDLVDDACDQLESIYKHMDGESKPDDFVEGEALIELRQMVISLMEALAWEG